MARILLIEDNPKNRYLVTFLLKSAGHEVVEALDGESGLQLARETRPDLILLDIQLPRKDGMAVLNDLREVDFLLETPVVAVTSYAMPGDRERILGSGCQDCLEKPINVDTFVEKVESYLK